MPNVWLAIMMMLLFAVSWGILPTFGGDWTLVVMPAAAIAINLMALLDLLVTTRHALPNALIPLVTVVGQQFGYILGGRW